MPYWISNTAYCNIIITPGASTLIRVPLTDLQKSRLSKIDNIAQIFDELDIAIMPEIIIQTFLSSIFICFSHFTKDGEKYCCMLILNWVVVKQKLVCARFNYADYSMSHLIGCLWAIPFKKLMGRMFDALFKNVAGWSEYDSEITVGWSYRSFFWHYYNGGTILVWHEID